VRRRRKGHLSRWSPREAFLRGQHLGLDRFTVEPVHRMATSAPVLRRLRQWLRGRTSSAAPGARRGPCRSVGEMSVAPRPRSPWPALGGRSLPIGPSPQRMTRSSLAIRSPLDLDGGHLRLRLDGHDHGRLDGQEGRVVLAGRLEDTSKPSPPPTTGPWPPWRPACSRGSRCRSGPTLPARS
jgi:hypothetical protein